MRVRCRQRGATMVELVIGIVILSLAGVALTAVISHSLRGWRMGTGDDTANSQITIAVQKLGNDVRDARRASTSENGQTLTVTFPSRITDGTTHETVYDLSGDDPTTRSYYKSGGNLVRNVGGQITILARDVYSVQFGADGGVVTATIVGTNTEITSESRPRPSVVGRIYLRNYRS